MTGAVCTGAVAAVLVEAAAAVEEDDELEEEVVEAAALVLELTPLAFLTKPAELEIG